MRKRFEKYGKVLVSMFMCIMLFNPAVVHAEKAQDTSQKLDTFLEEAEFNRQLSSLIEGKKNWNLL